jgi:hypothetical protein
MLSQLSRCAPKPQSASETATCADANSQQQVETSASQQPLNTTKISFRLGQRYPPKIRDAPWRAIAGLDVMAGPAEDCDRLALELLHPSAMNTRSGVRPPRRNDKPVSRRNIARF